MPRRPSRQASPPGQKLGGEPRSGHCGFRSIHAGASGLAAQSNLLHNDRPVSPKRILAKVPGLRAAYHSLRQSLPVARSFLRLPSESLAALLEHLPGIARGTHQAWHWSAERHSSELRDSSQLDLSNPLARYFVGHTEGAGMHKWVHYLDVYHRYLHRFVGTEVNVLEIGIASGGSLGMWKEYFGPRSRIYGVDVEPGCKMFEGPQTRVFIGDQSDRSFLRQVRDQVSRIDVLIDDGAHRPEHMIATLEEVLPAMPPGGVYICEDVHGNSPFAAYVYGLANALNLLTFGPADPAPSYCSPLQQAIGAIHFYPFMIVIEKAASPARCLVAPYRGTEWQPFHTQRSVVAPLDEQVAAAEALARQNPQPTL